MHNAVGGGELRTFEPVSDEMVLAAVDRAERHRRVKPKGVTLGEIAAHLGFVRSGWTTRQLRPRLDSLLVDGLLTYSRRHSVDCWGLTDGARHAGRVEELPESPQHRAWRQTRALAAEHVEEFRARATRETKAAVALFSARQRVRSDEWFLLVARLEHAYRQLGAATYCLYEWEEPDDARADIDNYEGIEDEQLETAIRDRLRYLRHGRRHIANPNDTHDHNGHASVALDKSIITVPAEMVSELRDGLHTVLGDAAQGISLVTDNGGRECHPEWYAEHGERLERTWALLDLIGWGEPKQPAAIRIDLRKHHQAVTEAFRVRLQVTADSLKEAHTVDAERAEHGEPSKRDATTRRVRTLREFAAAIQDLVDHG